jgi:hypothetical protein
MSEQTSASEQNAAPLAEPLDVLWGAAVIGRVIDRTERQTFYLLETGAIPARKVNGRWCATRRALMQHFETLASNGSPS